MTLGFWEFLMDLEWQLKLFSLVITWKEKSKKEERNKGCSGNSESILINLHEKLQKLYLLWLLAIHIYIRGETKENN